MLAVKLKPVIAELMIHDEILKILFHKSTIEKVEEMFSLNFNYNGITDRQPITNSEFTLRLYKPTNQFINFEFLVSSKSGLFFQPVALFDINGKIILMNEYKEAYSKIKTNLFYTDRTKFLTVQNNAVITAFSKEVFEHAYDILQEFNEFGLEPKITSDIYISGQKRYDKYLIVNGMRCELIFCNLNYPQFFLDDEYGFEGHIGAYIQEKDGINVVPSISCKTTFDNMNKLKLLTAFNSLK